MALSRSKVPINDLRKIASRILTWRTFAIKTYKNQIRLGLLPLRSRMWVSIKRKPLLRMLFRSPASACLVTIRQVTKHDFC